MVGNKDKRWVREEKYQKDRKHTTNTTMRNSNLISSYSVKDIISLSTKNECEK